MLNGFWKTNKRFISGLLLIFLSGGAGTVIVGPEDVAGAFRLLMDYKEVDEIIDQYEHDKEMLWEFAALISDNWDSTALYQTADDYGTVYEVDVRWINGPNDSGERIPVAFVGRPMFRIYPVHIAHRDGRWYINIHDNQSGETQNCYLYDKRD